MGMNGEHYEEEDARADYNNPYILELGDQLGGSIFSIRYDVTGYWFGGIDTAFRMSIVRDGNSEFSQDGKVGNLTFIVKNPGNYSIQWVSTYSNKNDWKRFDYWVDTYNTTELENFYFELVPIYEPVEMQPGTESKIGLKIINNNVWPIKMDHIDLTLGILSGEFTVETGDDIIQPGSSSISNLTFPISSDEEIGDKYLDVNLSFSMNVYGSWYDDLNSEHYGMAGPSVVQKDSDGDLVPDAMDQFPDDPTEAMDSDGDGVGNHEDEFPMNPNETKDSDFDGIGDNSDAFPDDSTEWSDLDGDGIGDNTDAFPKDASASKDTDNDGYPDEWNSGKEESDSTTGLGLDEYPSDGDKWNKSEDAPFIHFALLLLVVAFLCIINYNKRRGD